MNRNDILRLIQSKLEDIEYANPQIRSRIVETSHGDVDCIEVVIDPPSSPTRIIVELTERNFGYKKKP